MNNMCDKLALQNEKIEKARKEGYEEGFRDAKHLYEILDFKLTKKNMLMLKNGHGVITVDQFSDGDVSINYDEKDFPQSTIWILGGDAVREVIRALQKCEPLADKMYGEEKE